MGNRICSVPGCGEAAHCRGWCQRHYQAEYRAGNIEPIDRTRHHRLSAVDVSSATAICSICGPTEIRVRSARHGHQCMTLRKAEKGHQGPARRSVIGKDFQGDRVAKRREYKLRTKYGLTTEQYDGMVIDQGGRCAICDSPTETLVVDHDHETGKVRALLCTGCNTGIGHLRESVEIMTAAITYIRNHS